MAVSQVELGGNNKALGEVSAKPRFYTPNISTSLKQKGTDVAGIVNGITNLIGVYTQRQERLRIEQDEEDKIYGKQQAVNYSREVQTAIDTEQSNSEYLNQQVKQLKEAGKTNTEISKILMNEEFNRVQKDNGEEPLGKGDKAYLMVLSDNQSKLVGAYAEQDRKEIVTKMQNTIYSTADVLEQGESFDTALNDSIIMAKRYNIPEQQVYNMYIKKAYENAKNGDRTMLTSLKDIKHNGVKIVDTVEGSELNYNYAKQLDDLEYTKKQRAIASNNLAKAENINRLFGDYYANPDSVSQSNLMEKARDWFNSGRIDGKDYASLMQLHQREITADVKANKIVTDPNLYSGLYSQAQKGYLTQDALLMIADELNPKDLRELQELAIKQGGVNGIGNEESKQIEKSINGYAKSYSNYLTLENSAMADFSPEVTEDITRKYSMYMQVANSQLEAFVTRYKRNPDNVELDGLLKSSENESEKRMAETTVYRRGITSNNPDEIEATIKALPKARQQEVLNNLTKEQKQALLNNAKAQREQQQ